MMANKPVWVICDKKWADKIRDDVLGPGSGCLPPFSGKPCPTDEYGNTMKCRDCWLQFVDFEITDEEGDAE